VFNGMPQDFEAGRYHSLIAEPTACPTCSRSRRAPPKGEIMGVRHRSLPIEGVQFHPESVLTPDGPILMGNFLKI
jgi:anthranilate/para-aminobenzoate synthase component II